MNINDKNYANYGKVTANSIFSFCAAQAVHYEASGAG